VNNQTDFIVRQLRVLPKQRDAMIAALAKTDSSDRERRAWLTVFKRFTRMHRDCLHLADRDNMIPPEQLAALWREFVETGAAVCDGQAKIISAKLGSSKLSVNRFCALSSLHARVMKLLRDFEGYKDEAMQLAKSA
jgi:hypothetical protein